MSTQTGHFEEHVDKSLAKIGMLEHKTKTVNGTVHYIRTTFYNKRLTTVSKVLTKGISCLLIFDKLYEPFG